MTKGLGGDFCLICGSESLLYADRMCEPCTRARTRIAEVPENTNFTRCARCGLIDMHGRWVDVPEDIPVPLLEGAMEEVLLEKWQLSSLLERFPLQCSLLATS